MSVITKIKNMLKKKTKLELKLKEKETELKEKTKTYNTMLKQKRFVRDRQSQEYKNRSNLRDDISTLKTEIQKLKNDINAELLKNDLNKDIVSIIKLYL